MTLGERLAAYGLVLPPGHSLVSLEERPELREPLGDFIVPAWAEFLLHDPVANTLWDHLYEDFAAFQCVLFDAQGAIVAGLNSAPLAWDGTDDELPHGWDDQFRRSVEDHRAGTPVNTLGALQIVVGLDRQGSGLSAVMLEAMRANAADHGFRALIACVRPNHKVDHPRMPIAEYAARVRDDGLPEDPWIRVHVRAGGRMVRAVEDSMTIPGTLAEWREWTGLELPTSGSYVPDGAASPVVINVEAGRGVYHDPNVWVVHRLGEG